MLGTIEFLALFLALVYNGWQLSEIRKISKACYVELVTARWENGCSVRIKDERERLSSVSG